MKDTQVLKRKNCIIVFCILCMSLLIGSFYDFQISKNLYDSHNLLGILCAGYGQLPAILCASISGLLLLKIAKSFKPIHKVMSIIAGTFLQMIGILAITIDSSTNIKELPLSLAFLIACVIIAFSDFIILHLTHEADIDNMKKVIVLLLVTVCLELLVITVVKEVWSRPRMRMIVQMREVSFQPWWIIGNELKDHLMNFGVAAEEFRSFPSGHTGNAACAILLTTLPFISTRFQGKENVLFWIGVGIAMIVALSRIIAGAHFLSDVTIGLTITFIIEMIVVNKIFKKE